MRGGLPLFGIILALFFVAPAKCQTSLPEAASPQILKEWDLGKHVAQDLDASDGRVDDTVIAEYLQRVEQRIATATGAVPIEIRVPRSTNEYANLLPNRVLYTSGGLLERVASEAELAGLLAHQLAHVPESAGPPRQGTQIAFIGACVLVSPSAPIGWSVKMRGTESRATAVALGYLRAANYDPLEPLGLFSKLVYDHPSWAKAIVPEDLLSLRSVAEMDAVPPVGLVADASEFAEFHAALAAALGHTERARRRAETSPPTLQRR